MRGHVSHTVQGKYSLAGLSIQRSTYRGAFETRGTARTCISLHVGEPVDVDCECGGQSFRGTQHAGSIDLIPAHANGRWRVSGDEEVVLISVAPRFFRESAITCGINPARMNLQPRFQIQDAQLLSIASAMSLAVDDSAQTEPLLVESLGHALASRLVSKYASQGTPPPGAPQELTPRQSRRIVEHVEQNLTSGLTVAELAQIAGLGTSHFKVLFKRTFGTPVHQYVIERRVKRAAQLIEEGGRSVSDVAAATGFAHQSHLARCMRRVLGATPSTLARARR